MFFKNRIITDSFSFFISTWMACCIMVVNCVSCNKLVQVPEPSNSVTTLETFRTEANATSALTAIYSNMSRPYGNGTIASYGSGATTLLCGLSADELNLFSAATDEDNFQTNSLLSTNSDINNIFWSAIYGDIYKANAVIEGVQSSSTLSSAVKNQLTGEAKFIRAFCHFYLVNLFGDIPLVTTTSFTSTSLIARTSADKVYKQIFVDLQDAQSLLQNDYAVSGGERIRANKWAATALLARVYLYTGKWKDAEIQATSIIENGSYNLVNDLNGVFLMNNTEAILQLKAFDDDPWATNEGYAIIPYDSTSSPTYYLTKNLLSAFELGDQRRISWLDSTDYSGTYYYYPFKYKVRQGTPGNITEYYTILRLSEQYLIRAEARAEQNNTIEAIDDLNIIRSRATLNDLSNGLTQAQTLAAVAQERRIEFFAEWGHRWLDLKRTNQADVILSIVKPDWKPTSKLYPIPFSELQVDPNLKQNEGY